jgi:hypothetical protein
VGWGGGAHPQARWSHSAERRHERLMVDDVEDRQVVASAGGGPHNAAVFFSNKGRVESTLIP